MTEPETPTARALLEDPAILGRFPDDVNGIPGRGNLQWLRQHLVAIEAEARRADRPDPRRLVRAVDGMGEDGECPVHTIDGRQYVAKDDVVCVINDQRPAPRPPEPDRTLCAECSHERQYHDAPGEECGCEGDGEAGFCICPGYVRPPEPDRTALVEALVAAVDRWNHVRNEVAPARWSRVHDLRAVDEALIAANEAVRVALATPEPAPVADGHALTNDCIGGGCTDCETEPPAGIEP